MIYHTTKKRIKIYKELSSCLVENNVEKISFVVYLRPQHEHVNSFWKEHIKHVIRQPFHKDVERKYIKYIHDYYAFIKVMEECIKIHHEIVIRIYDRNNIIGGDIYHDFCNTVKIPWSDDFEIPKFEINNSFTFDVSEALRTIQPCVPQKYKFNVLKVALALSNE